MTWLLCKSLPLTVNHGGGAWLEQCCSQAPGGGWVISCFRKRARKRDVCSTNDAAPNTHTHTDTWNCPVHVGGQDLNFNKSKHTPELYNSVFLTVLIYTFTGFKFIFILNMAQKSVNSRSGWAANSNQQKKKRGVIQLFIMIRVSQIN